MKHILMSVTATVGLMACSHIADAPQPIPEQTSVILAPSEELSLAIDAGAADQIEWHLTVASWNLMNFSINKATYPATGLDRAALLTSIGATAGAYDILVFQEVLQTGASITAHLINYLPAGYACNHISAPSGRAGRQERYVVCAPAANPWGTIAIAPILDYSTTGAAYIAADGTARPAANVWMRPPIIATVTFTPNEVTFPPKVFDIYTNHTKPAYGYSANARPAGTVAGAPNSSSVHYEMRAIEQNQAAGANKMLIGDLNADCASYGVQYRGQDFAAGWHWNINYGQRTNTAVGSSCAYDRILLNDSLNLYYEEHDVDYDHYGNATRLSGKRVSDHYLVWVKLGEVRNKKRKASISVSTASPVTQANKVRKFDTTSMMNVTGMGMQASIAHALLYAVPYSTAQNFDSNFTYPLTDVRGVPSSVSTDSTGNFVSEVTWATPPAGAYVFVFDANADGQYSRADGDIVNFGTQADILVTKAITGHNTIVTLGDNLVLRDVFDLDQAYNIYALAKDLPINSSGHAYIISTLLLREAGYESWQQARDANIALDPYAIPIQLAGTGIINTSTITAEDSYQTFTTNPNGETFFSAWSKPGQLMNASVNYTAPPASVFKPEYAGAGDPPNSPDDTEYDDDPCQNAATSKDEGFQQACNLGFLFPNHYGNTFSLVLDLDKDGTLGPNDPIDLRDIGDMTAYFSQAGNTTLGPNANGNPAVSEYKEYLERALSVTLSNNDTYDAPTQSASGRYACGSNLTKTDFDNYIKQDSQTGFRVLDSDSYISERSGSTGLYQFDNASLDNWTSNNVTQCINGRDLTYTGNLDLNNNANVTSIGNSHTFDAVQVTSNASISCWATVEATAGTALAVGAGSGFFTLGGGLIAGVVVAASTTFVGAATCGL